MDAPSLPWVLVAFLFGLVIKEFLPAYIRKKGENLATKEDIAAITSEVESVKAAISRESRLFSTKQELLMAFYDQVTELYYERLAVNFGDFPMDDGRSLFEHQAQFNKSVAEIVKAYQRLVIFLGPKSKLLKVAEKIVRAALEARKVHKNLFGEVKTTAVKEQHAYQTGDPAKTQLAANEADEANSKFWREMRTHVEEVRDHYQDFLSEMNSFVSSGQK